MSFFSQAAASAALTIWATFVSAQEGPSYDETANFIISKSNLSYKNGTSTRVEFSQRCTMRIVREARDNGPVYHREIDTIPLSKVDPTRITLDNGQVGIYVREGRASITEQHTPLNGGKPSTKLVNFTWLSTFDSANNAPRLQSALMHLVKLCGGKGELF